MKSGPRAGGAGKEILIPRVASLYINLTYIYIKGYHVLEVKSYGHS
jgi:hypothetical protein